MLLRLPTLAFALFALGSSIAGATPTPVPGGANQVAALAAPIGKTVFNGNLRITVSGLRDATDAETAAFLPNSDQKVMAFSVLLRNGTKSEFTDLIAYALADKDDVSVSIGSFNLHPGNLHILQGAAARQTALFAVDKNFTPVKLLVQCSTCGARSGFRAVRFTIPQS